MSVRHLNDKELQNLLEDKNSIHYEHLKQCKHCQSEFEMYKLISEDLSLIEIPEPKAELSNMIMANIQAAAKEEKESYIFIWLSTLAATLMAASVVIYFYGIDKFMLQLNQFSLSAIIPEFTFVQDIISYVNSNSSSLTIVGLAVLTILFYQSLEFIISKVKANKLSSFSF